MSLLFLEELFYCSLVLALSYLDVFKDFWHAYEELYLRSFQLEILILDRSRKIDGAVNGK